MNIFLAVLVVLVSTVSASAQVVVFDDTFDTGASLFTAHTPHPVGVGWTPSVDTCAVNTVPFIVYASSKAAVSSVDANNALNPIPGGWTRPWLCKRLYLAETAQPLSPDTVTAVHWEIDGGSSGRFWGLASRVQPNGDLYLAGYYLGYLNGGVPLINPNCFLGKVISGVYTQLVAGTCGLTVQEAPVGSLIEFRVVGDMLKLFTKGIERLSASGGGAINQPGRGGWLVGNWRQASDAWSEGGAYYDFKVTDLGGEPLPDPPVTTCTRPTGGPVTATESGATYTVPLGTPLLVGQSFTCEKVQP